MITIIINNNDVYKDDVRNSRSNDRHRSLRSLRPRLNDSSVRCTAGDHSHSALLTKLPIVRPIESDFRRVEFCACGPSMSWHTVNYVSFVPSPLHTSGTTRGPSPSGRDCFVFRFFRFSFFVSHASDTLRQNTECLDFRITRFILRKSFISPYTSYRTGLERRSSVPHHVYSILYLCDYVV